MNSGLPSLLDAIFGKKDLASVSLDEMHEVINEFPSFNAAHFFLAKKLKYQHDAAYEKESMRTALYFNNAYWLQTLLDEDNHIAVEEKPASEDFSPSVPLGEGSHFTGNSATEPFEIEFSDHENITGTVTSFDELISKYKIEPVDVIYESPVDIGSAVSIEHSHEPLEQPPVEAQDRFSYGGMDEPHGAPDAAFSVQAEEPVQASIPVSTPEPAEFTEEIINEYGIFEEVIVRKNDDDLEAFDRLMETVPLNVEMEPVGIQAGGDENIIENQLPEEPVEKPVEQDYESFDRPVEIPENEFVPVEEPEPVEDLSEIPDQASEETENTEMQSGENGMEDQMDHLTGRYEEQQKSMATFDTKKAEAIVFAPYHMIDYFASQGIKLVLEDNPADSLGKQLKSFTDWLKVLKKLPVQSLSEKPDEKEAERIRHFAAHSLEDRDILTESMAEVLAKQGMYENAIALYQKLSLIYPPKSAYFASRIEQLKASLP